MNTNQLKEQAREIIIANLIAFEETTPKNKKSELRPKVILENIYYIIDRTVQITEERNKISFLKFVSKLPTFRDYHFELNGTPYCDHSEILRGKQDGEMVDLINRYSLYRFLVGKNTGHVEQYSSEDLLKDVEFLITNKSNLSGN